MDKIPSPILILIISNFKKHNHKLYPLPGVLGLSCSLLDSRILQILISRRVSHCSPERLVLLKIKRKRVEYLKLTHVHK